MPTCCNMFSLFKLIINYIEIRTFSVCCAFFLNWGVIFILIFSNDVARVPCLCHSFADGKHRGELRTHQPNCQHRPGKHPAKVGHLFWLHGTARAYVLLLLRTHKAVSRDISHGRNFIDLQICKAQDLTVNTVKWNVIAKVNYCTPTVAQLILVGGTEKRDVGQISLALPLGRLELLNAWLSVRQLEAWWMCCSTCSSKTLANKHFGVLFLWNPTSNKSDIPKI